jgi:hypothetical protein
VVRSHRVRNSIRSNTYGPLDTLSAGKLDDSPSKNKLLAKERSCS